MARNVARCSQLQKILQATPSTSLIETMSAFAVLTSFLTNLSLLSLMYSSHQLKRLLAPFYVPRMMWWASHLNTLGPHITDHVRKLVVNNDVSSVQNFLSQCTHLRFADNFNRPLSTIGCLAFESVTSLSFGRHFNQKLEAGVLPPRLKMLTLGAHFTEIEPGVLPTTLEELQIPGVRSLELGMLPQGLQRLQLGEGFNHHFDVGVLPSSLRHLGLGSSFNQPLGVGVLPERLTCLNFPDFFLFSYPIDSAALPSGLTELGIGKLPPGLPQTKLPSKLTRLKFGYHFEDRLEPGLFPTTLTALRFPETNYLPVLVPDLLPSGLRILHLAAYQSEGRILPEGLTELSMTPREELRKGVLPLSLTDLTLCCSTYLQPGVLPSRLLRLKLILPTRAIRSYAITPDNLHAPLFVSQPEVFWSRVLPASLTELGLHLSCEPLKAGILLPNLAVLRLVNTELHLKKGVLPSSLRELYLRGVKTSFEEDDVWPFHLSTLVLGCDKLPRTLPPNLTSLEFQDFQSRIPHDYVPAGLLYLNYGSTPFESYNT